MKFTAVGDVIIGRRIPEGFEGFRELTPIVEQGDFRFFNLETTINPKGECFASEISGGTYLRTERAVLEDVKKFGFNVTSFNNNHIMDYSFDGLLQTLDAVEGSGLVHGGVGRNLGEAAAPCYLETEAGRVAMISVNATVVGQMIAGEQTDRVKGRPGINPLRVKKHVELPPEEFDTLQKIIRTTGINAQRELEQKEGYHGGYDPSAETVNGLRFVRGNETKFVRTVDEQDLERVKKAIYEAQLQADYIAISLHAHEMDGTEKEEPAEFLKEFSRFCIDNGADAVVGHGPHLLRPIEIYNGKPIFYSLGDFVLQLYNLDYAPKEMYEQYHMKATETVHELLRVRSKDFSIGLMTDRRMFEAVIPYWETDENNRVTKLTLHPIVLSMDGNKSETGLPRLAKSTDYLKDFLRRCETYGTEFVQNEDGTLSCIL